MPRKPKFRPEITRVKLNPEQAVLACACWNGGYRTTTGGDEEVMVLASGMHCQGKTKVVLYGATGIHKMAGSVNFS